MEAGCNENNYAELIYTVADLANAKADMKEGEQPKIAFYDRSNNLLDEFFLGGGGCDWYEENAVDSMKICAAWMKQTNKVIIFMNSDDAIMIKHLTMTVIDKTRFKQWFWLDNPIQCKDYICKAYFYHPVFTQIEFMFDDTCHSATDCFHMIKDGDI